MERKSKSDGDPTPILVPIGEEEFFTRIRAIVHEELKLMVKGTSKGQVHQVDGLKYKPIYDLGEVRQLFGNVSRSTIYEWIDAGILKPKKMKGKVYFLWADIQKTLGGDGVTNNANFVG